MPIKKKNNIKTSIGFSVREERANAFSSGALPDDIGPGAYDRPGIADTLHTYNKSQANKQFGIGQKKFHSLKAPM